MVPGLFGLEGDGKSNLYHWHVILDMPHKYTFYDVCFKTGLILMIDILFA